ncbi:20018_t:CDS:1, partial [Cetraspora pellucida]
SNGLDWTGTRVPVDWTNPSDNPDQDPFLVNKKTMIKRGILLKK